MAEVTSVTLLKEIKNILKGADLKKLSAKAVRKTLEEVLKTDLTNRKKEIDDMLMDMITESSSRDNNHNSTGEESEVKSEAEDSDQESPPPKKKSKSNAKTKKQKKAASDDSLSASESDNERKNSDEALAKRLQEEESLLPRRSAFIKASTKKKSKSKKSKDPKEKKKGASNSVYSRPCTLSADLAEVVGAAEMPRHSVVKKMWEIARERNLFDPTNKRFIICDDQLFKMFGAKRILMFGIMKHLKTHIKDQKDLAK